MIRSRKNPLLVRFVPALLILIGTPAQGALIRYDFGGVVTGSPAGAYAIGDRFTGSLIYDDALPILDDGSDAEGMDHGYYYSGTHRSGGHGADGTGLDIRVGGISIIAPSTGLTGEVSIAKPADAPSTALLTFSSYPRSGSDGQPGAFVGFKGLANSVFHEGDYPTSSLDLSDLTFASVEVESVAGSGYLPYLALLHGNIDTLTVTPVPEPAWTVAAMMGLALAAARLRRRAD
ncbi:hypothetical protein [Paludisphaera soli]|uniref:hypothetical protein n=1 Tax=Paludisphaera soli TaxID=2712865 RepID=UPI0013EDADE1|nr:hypothetical protein [Paludisphaera soli]